MMDAQTKLVAASREVQAAETALQDAGRVVVSGHSFVEAGVGFT